MANKKKNSKRTQTRKKIDKSLIAEYDYHLPVLLQETCDFLVTDENGIYLDGTLGGGGHAAEILKRLGSGGNLLAFDKDINAIEHCAIRFEDELKRGASSRIILNNECYSKACSKEDIWGKISGLLLDLGVSSRQLDTNSRGISYRVDSPLDMRFGDKGSSAQDLLYSSDEIEIERILRDYGEEPFARVIARRIIERRRASTLNSTADLRAAVEESVPARLHIKALSRTFQAIRIAVNSELEVLRETITNIVPLMAPGGRIVIISYHSLEDRIVKTIFKELSKKEKFNQQLPGVDKAKFMPNLKLITPKPFLPTDKEIISNPRARSAKLRVAEKN